MMQIEKTKNQKQVEAITEHLKRTVVLTEYERDQLIRQCEHRPQIFWFDKIPSTPKDPPKRPYVHFGTVKKELQIKYPGCVKPNCKYCYAK